MNYNYSLAREIYSQAWLVDSMSYSALTSLLKSIQNGSNQVPEEKLNSVSLLSDFKLVQNLYQLDNSEDFEGIGIININGVIISDSTPSTRGMRQIASEAINMAKDKRVKSFILYGNSGGGASGAVEIMTDAISYIQNDLGKEVIGYVPQAGSAYSAMYGIISACSKVVSGHEMNGFGSVGTMIEFEGKAHESVDSDGYKTVRLYATKSVMKNKSFEDAINTDNYEMIVSEMLDPINERFINLVQTNRPQLKETNFDDGRIVFAKDAVGTYIDEIKSFSEVVSELQQKTASVLINNNNKMTVSELKQNHPETYNAIFSEGVKSEADRVGAWMAHSKTDLEIVSNGIKSNEPISSAIREELLVKANEQNHLRNLQGDSPSNVEVPESGAPQSQEELAQSFKNKFDI